MVSQTSLNSEDRTPESGGGNGITHLVVDLVAFLAVLTAAIVLVLLGHVDAGLLTAVGAFVIGAFRVFRTRR